MFVFSFNGPLVRLEASFVKTRFLSKKEKEKKKESFKVAQNHGVESTKKSTLSSSPMKIFFWDILKILPKLLLKPLGLATYFYCSLKLPILPLQFQTLSNQLLYPSMWQSILSLQSLSSLYNFSRVINLYNLFR